MLKELNEYGGRFLRLGLLMLTALVLGSITGFVLMGGLERPGGTIVAGFMLMMGIGLCLYPTLNKVPGIRKEILRDNVQNINPEYTNWLTSDVKHLRTFYKEYIRSTDEAKEIFASLVEDQVRSWNQVLPGKELELLHAAQQLSRKAPS